MLQVYSIIVRHLYNLGCDPQRSIVLTSFCKNPRISKVGSKIQREERGGEMGGGKKRVD